MIRLEHLEKEDLKEIVEWNANKSADYLTQWAGPSYSCPLTLEQICLYREAGVSLEHIKELLNENEKSDTISEYHLINLIMFVGTCFLGISIGQFFLIKTAIPYMIALVLIGGSVACAVVFWQLLIQLNTPDNMTGRVFSVSTLVGNASLPIAYGIFDILLAYISIMKLMFFSGLCLILL